MTLLTGILLIHHNEFVGTLPSQLGNLSLLRECDVSFNNFVGTIPFEMSRMFSLDELYFESNNLVGSVPVEFCDYDMVHLWSDCIEEMTCACCDQCRRDRNNEFVECAFSDRCQTGFENDDCFDIDDSGDCPYWASIGECFNNPGYMLEFCGFSCGGCGDCFNIDDSGECPVWASTGECSNNPGYMLEFCAFSCGEC